MYVICIFTLQWHFILYTLSSTFMKYILTDKSKSFYIVPLIESIIREFPSLRVLNKTMLKHCKPLETYPKDISVN